MKSDKTPDRLNLDKVERMYLEKIKKKNPAYADLELYQIAHLELKNRLQELLIKSLFLRLVVVGSEKSQNFRKTFTT